MSCRRLLLPAAALLALCLATPAAAAPEPRIVNGALAQEGEYPAQGYLWVDSDLNDEIDFACGGTLVGSRQFLTAAHCVVNALGQPVPPAGFKVYLGHVDLADPTQDIYTVSDPPERHPDFVRTTLRNDVAMITLDRPADYELMRVVDDGEDALWEAGTSARVIGWGQNAGGAPQEKLREADVPIITDDRCAAAHTAFDPEIMVCAAHDPGTPPGQRGDICVGDGGGPLLAREGASYVLAGVAALDTECGDPDEPGVYTRVGDEFEGSNLNSWVHDRIPEADFEFSHAPRANEPVTLTSISRHPEGADYFKLVRWDFDEDRFFDDAFGQSVTHTFPAAGEYVVGIEASTAGGDKTSAYFAFNVAPDPNAPPTGQLAPPATTTPTPVATAKPAGFMATIHAAKRPKVKRGRFNISVRFARTAPAGVAVVEVYRGKRKIGIARSRVRRGGTRRISVKLTPTGRRMLARSATKRLKLRVRVRVGRSVLRSKTLTVRR